MGFLGKSMTWSTLSTQRPLLPLRVDNPAGERKVFRIAVLLIAGALLVLLNVELEHNACEQSVAMRRDPACKVQCHHLPMYVTRPDPRVLIRNAHADGKGA